MDALGMPKKSDSEKQQRMEALENATRYATEVPLRTMKCALQVFDLLEDMIHEGNPNSVSDAGVGVLAVRAAILGAHLNVRINAAGLKDRTIAEELVNESDAIADMAIRKETELLAIVKEKIG